MNATSCWLTLVLSGPSARLLSGVALASLLAPGVARADQPPPPGGYSMLVASDDGAPPAAAGAAAAATRAPLDQVPRLGLVESPYGLNRTSGFVALSGLGTSAKSTNEAEGGVRVGFAPIDRLTLHAFAGRDALGRFSPSATGHVRLLGSLPEGRALGALVQYKAEGFSELGGEVEAGFTGGVRVGRWSLAGNLVAGVGVEEEEEGEVDGEAKARAAYEVAPGVRLGVEGQARRRFAGPNKLAGGRDWDALGGLQVSWQGEPVVAASFGPSTMGVASGVGAYGMLTVAAVVGR